MSRATITGFGAITPLGGTGDATWAALLRGESGAAPLTEEWALALPTRLAARVDDAFAEGLTVRERRRLDRAEQLAVVAARQAWESAGRPEIDPTRVAVVIGTAVGGIATTLEQAAVLDRTGPRRVSPHTVPMLMPNGPAAWAAIDLGAQGGARTPISACSSGVEAIMMGREMILAGTADIVVCGGAEAAILPFALASFGAARALSTRNEDAAHASRPFDVTRDGFVLGEGCVLVVLEAESHARARGAAVHGVVSGAALTSDAFDIVRGDPSNQTRTMGIALRNAGLDPADIGFVHAHATSTPAGDLVESKAITAALPSLPPVTSTKASTGHLLGASGSLSTLVAALGLRDGLIPPTINLDAQDPAIDLDIVSGTPRPTAARHALVNSFGFGGHSVSLILSRD